MLAGEQFLGLAASGGSSCGLPHERWFHPQCLQFFVMLRAIAQVKCLSLCSYYIMCKTCVNIFFFLCVKFIISTKSTYNISSAYTVRIHISKRYGKKLRKLHFQALKKKKRGKNKTKTPHSLLALDTISFQIMLECLPKEDTKPNNVVLIKHKLD